MCVSAKFSLAGSLRCKEMIDLENSFPVFVKSSWFFVWGGPGIKQHTNEVVLVKMSCASTAWFPNFSAIVLSFEGEKCLLWKA